MDGFNSEVIWVAKRIGMKPNELQNVPCGEFYNYLIYEMNLHNQEMAQYDNNNESAEFKNIEEID